MPAGLTEFDLRTRRPPKSPLSNWSRIETYPQTQPRLNLATFVTTYMDDYATRLMNEAITPSTTSTKRNNIRARSGDATLASNIVANLWNTEKAEWKNWRVGHHVCPKPACWAVAAWLRWRNRRKAGKPFHKPNLKPRAIDFRSCGRSSAAVADRDAHRASD